MQRFGTTSLPTHEIGKVILKKNWKKAVELILMEKKGGKIFLYYFLFIKNYTYDNQLFRVLYCILIYILNVNERKRKNKQSKTNMERNT